MEISPAVLPAHWTDARVDTLKSMHSKGFSASQIGAEIGMSRNAVIGKVHRLGLSGRMKPHSTKPKAPRVRPSKRQPSWITTGGPPLLEQAPVPEPPEPPENPPLNLALVELTSDTCRWPFGEGPFTFCGHTTLTERPYCVHHCRMSYVAPSGRVYTGRAA